MDEELRQRYLEAKRAGKGPVTCAREVGATVRAMNAYIAADLDFALQVEEAEAEAIERVANAAMEMAQKGHKDFALPLLQARMPEDWLPVKDINMRFQGQGDDEIDIGELHKKLAAHYPKELPRGEDPFPDADEA